MKEFFRSLLGSCLGVFLAIMILVLLFVGIGVAVGGSSGGEMVSPENGILKLTFSSAIPEKTGNINQEFGSGDKNIGLRNFTRLIANASKDENIKGIVLNANSLSMGQATLLQLRSALEDFKKSGKFLYAYADSYSQSSYCLSSIADSIFLNPNGDVGLQGYAIVSPYFKNMLDKVGVDFNIFYAGNFKSATEPLRRENMSPEDRFQTKTFLNDMLSVMKEKISTSRKIDIATLDKIMNNLDGRNSELSLQNKLVDKVCYWDQFETIVKKKAGLDHDKKINYLSLEDYDFISKIKESGSSKSKIAVVYAEGDVIYNDNKKGSIDNTRYIKIFDKIKRDENIKALVLRVNSGGGSSLTSDIIWREIETIKAKGIPVIASFGDYAASGGYYIAAGADSIVASPNTLTGSIGVFSILPNFRKLANEKFGINFDTVKTHELSNNMSTVYPLSEKEKKYMTESTDQIYSQFLDRVSTGRGMPKDSVHKYAQGRVWTGERAKEIGLVDEIGFLDRAIEIAAGKAKIKDDYKVVEYPQIKKSFMEEIIENAMRQQKADEEAKLSLNKKTIEYIKLFNKYNAIINDESVQARMLYEVYFD